MKKYIFVFLTIVIANCTYSVKNIKDYEKKEFIILSEEIGEVLDIEEREHYGLLSGIDNFREARIYGQPDSSFALEITTKKNKLIAYYQNPLIIGILIEYIQKFDSIPDTWEMLERKWKILDYDDLGLPITADDINRYKNHFSCCISGGCLASTIGGVLGAAINGTLDDSGWEDLSTIAAALGGCLAGFPVGAIAGYFYEDKYVFKRIKEARRMYVVEGKN